MRNVKEFYKWIAVIILTTVSIVGWADSSSLYGSINDSAITAQIKGKLMADPATNALNVSVTTNNGVVILNGTATSKAELEQAVKLAESTKGVKDVNTDNFTVLNSTQPLTDSIITAKVNGKYLSHTVMKHSEFPASSISVETQNGVVYLTGTLDKQWQINEAVHIAKTVNGVTNVVSLLKLS